MLPDFRFGLNLFVPASGSRWIDKCRRAEDLGFDVLLFSDHIGLLAPFSSLVVAAQATSRPRVGTFMLNAAFWHPTLLAREAASAARLTDGRFELGLGTGYARAEIEAAGLPWARAGARVDRLERTVAEVSRQLSRPPQGFQPLTGCTPPLPDDPGDDVAVPPLVIGGAGPRVLRLAATHADVVAFAGTKPAPDGRQTLAGPDEIAEQVALVDRHAAGRHIEKNILLYSVVHTATRQSAVEQVGHYRPDLSPEELLELPALLAGSPRTMAERLIQLHERYGFSYVAVLEPSMEAFATVIAELR
ncbi:MAG TPA: TIGR03621 family F420-dependent LLM class oxidoreductase [Pseudonocardiaceae bacterium]|nr:TIGR03621 family F420-dependent LLM class oxidoreductase [Pseudonocardiaceae bacterium]